MPPRAWPRSSCLLLFPVLFAQPVTAHACSVGPVGAGPLREEVPTGGPLLIYFSCEDDDCTEVLPALRVTLGASPVAGTTEVLLQEVRELYLRWTPLEPLTGGATYHAELAADPDHSFYGDEFDFHATEGAAWHPADTASIQPMLGTTSQAIGQAYCCPALLECSEPCWTDRVALRAFVGWGTGTLGPNTLYRFRWKEHDGSTHVGGWGAQVVFSQSADEYCVDLELLDLATNLTDSKRSCFPPAEGVAYGSEVEVDYTGSFPSDDCRRPPGTKGRCEPGSAECPLPPPRLLAAWCEGTRSEVSCPSDLESEQDTCDILTEHCPTQPGESGPDHPPPHEHGAEQPSTGARNSGCSATRGVAAEWLLWGLCLATGALSRRRGFSRARRS
jgi:hypothetical protein